MGKYREGCSRTELTLFGGGGLLHTNREHGRAQEKNGVTGCTVANCKNFQRILPVDNDGNVKVLLSEDFANNLLNPNGGDVFNAMAPLFGAGADQQCLDAFLHTNASYIQQIPDSKTNHYEFVNPDYGKPNILPNLWFTIPKECLQPTQSLPISTELISPEIEVVATRIASPPKKSPIPVDRMSAPNVATPSYPEESTFIPAQEKPFDRVMVISVLGGVVGVVTLITYIKKFTRHNQVRPSSHATTPIAARNREPEISSPSVGTRVVRPNQTVVIPETAQQIQERLDHVDAVFASNRLAPFRSTRIGNDGTVEVKNTGMNAGVEKELQIRVATDRTLLEHLTQAAGSEVTRVKVASVK